MSLNGARLQELPSDESMWIFNAPSMIQLPILICIEFISSSINEWKSICSLRVCNSYNPIYDSPCSLMLKRNLLKKDECFSMMPHKIISIAFYFVLCGLCFRFFFLFSVLGERRLSKNSFCNYFIVRFEGGCAIHYRIVWYTDKHTCYRFSFRSSNMYDISFGKRATKRK